MLGIIEPIRLLVVMVCTASNSTYVTWIRVLYVLSSLKFSLEIYLTFRKEFSHLLLWFCYHRNKETLENYFVKFVNLHSTIKCLYSSMVCISYVITYSADVSSSSVRSNPWAAAAATAARLAFVSSQNLRHLASARYC